MAAVAAGGLIEVHGYPQGGDARNTIAMAFQELAANAQKIGELNVSPDLLRTLVGSAVQRG